MAKQLIRADLDIARPLDVYLNGPPENKPLFSIRAKTVVGPKAVEGREIRFVLDLEEATILCLKILGNAPAEAMARAELLPKIKAMADKLVKMREAIQ